MNLSSSRLLFDLPSRYRIHIHGRLSVDWADRLQEVTITVKQAIRHEQVTRLTCEVRDQAALMGVLNMLYDMGLPLLKVERLSPPPSTDDRNRVQTKCEQAMPAHTATKS